MRISENDSIFVTDVRLDLGSYPVLAYADITLNDGFVVHGLRLVHINSERMLVCMPSRPYQFSCESCSHRNSVANKFCGHCGCKVAQNKTERIYMDVAHPINADVRKRIEESVIDAYNNVMNSQKAA